MMSADNPEPAPGAEAPPKSREAEAAALPEADSEAWRRVQLARHPQRPNFVDWLPALCTDFAELHGDRRFGDDAAIVAGLARFRGREVMVVGQQKGREIKEKIRRNFGMPQPEGYRKALRLMQLAEKFRRPILTFVDTNGAYPGLDAEERGQAEAIAFNLREMARLRVPIVATITGEGGSGGALAIAVGNRVLMLENAIYSVITPEGCASITWRDASMKARAAAALKPTAAEMLNLGLIDEVVPEPPGGAHHDPAGAARLLGDALERHLDELQELGSERIVLDRYQRFRKMGGAYVYQGGV
ncbi:MAG TPA: acetyl-CoA carboxylase carboxyltransferase subunit alpha [Terriglobales bacterium]|nr:acetyl-CoA carboxylase carboxyltransferase subunit alpha [Terriglobales bacterium]